MDIPYGSSYCHLPKPAESAWASQAIQGDKKQISTGRVTQRENKAQQTITGSETATKQLLQSRYSWLKLCQCDTDNAQVPWCPRAT